MTTPSCTEITTLQLLRLYGNKKKSFSLMEDEIDATIFSSCGYTGNRLTMYSTMERYASERGCTVTRRERPTGPGEVDYEFYFSGCSED